MSAELNLTKQITDVLGRPHCVLSGRGTTALWLALRAILRRDGPGEVILPDILCATAVDGVLLAGFKPVFADVIPARFTLSASSVSQLVTPRTRAILVTHLFGHVADIKAIRQAAPGIPIIEDAVQGIGGHDQERPVGSLGDLSFISFDRYKMIGGRGSALLFDDTSLAEGIEADLRRLPMLPTLQMEALNSLLPPTAAAEYAVQLRTAFAPDLLRQFIASSANLTRILNDWDTLEARVAERNAKALWLHTHIGGLPVILPDLHRNDAIWCFTVTAPSVALARRMIRDLRDGGLSATGLYPSLSRWFNQPGDSTGLNGRLVNLWVDPATDSVLLQRTANVIAAMHWAQTVPA